MRTQMLSALTLGVLFTVAAAAPAQEAKPVVVVSFGGYQRLLDDVNYIGNLINKPGASQQVEGLLQFFTQGMGLAGLDKSKPWGAVASVTMGPGGPMPSVIGFLPVTDLDQLMQALAAAQPEKQDDGSYKLQNPQATIFVKAQNGWAYIGQSQEALSNVPADPMSLVSDLNKKYDVAVQVHPRNVPPQLRQMFVGQFQAQAAAMERNEGESEEAFEARQKLTQQQFDAITKQIDDLDRVLVGVSIDSDAQKLLVDVDLTYASNSSSAANLKLQQGLKSSFSGFVIPESPVTLSMRQHLGEDEIAQAMTGIDTARPTLLQEIENSEDLNDEEKATAKHIANQVLDVVAATIKSGDIDTSLSVVGEGPLAVIGATNVANPSELEQATKSLAEAASKADSSVSALKVNAEQHKGVRFHTLQITLPDGAPPQVAQLLGSPVQLAFGFGEKSAYFGGGVDAIAKIKQAIDRSDTSAAAGTPFSLVVSVAPILKAAAMAAPNHPAPAMLAGQLPSGSDHVRVKVEPIDNGQRIRVEVEEGLIKLIGIAAPNAGGPPGGNN